MKYLEDKIHPSCCNRDRYHETKARVAHQEGHTLHCTDTTLSQCAMQVLCQEVQGEALPVVVVGDTPNTERSHAC